MLPCTVYILGRCYLERYDLMSCYFLTLQVFYELIGLVIFRSSINDDFPL